MSTALGRSWSWHIGGPVISLIHRTCSLTFIDFVKGNTAFNWNRLMTDSLLYVIRLFIVKDNLLQ